MAELLSPFLGRPGRKAKGLSCSRAAAARSREGCRWWARSRSRSKKKGALAPHHCAR